MPRFANPDAEQDKKFLADEAAKKGFDWSKVFWKPKKATTADDADNVIRIMPPRADSGATYHLRIGKHFIKHGDNDVESFICMAETYGQPCPACEKRREIYATIKDRNLAKQEAAKYAVKKYGVFNVIDRLAYADYKEGRIPELPAVMLWEAPRQLVWDKVVRNFASKGRTSNLFDVYDKNGEKVVKPGRDILIKFYPESSSPATMYDVQYLDPVELGTPDEVAKWFEQIIDLLPEKITLYLPIDYHDAEIKTFGSKEERVALRAKHLKELEDKKASEEAPPAEQAAPPAEDDDVPAEEEAPAPAPKAAAPKVTEKPKPAQATPAPASNDLKARIDAVKARVAAGKKA